jgi:hypothetical protein
METHARHITDADPQPRNHIDVSRCTNYTVNFKVSQQESVTVNFPPFLVCSQASLRSVKEYKSEPSVSA